MELTIRRTAGILGLIEFRTPEKSSIHFENSFGLIKDRRLLFIKQELTIDVDDIEAMQLIEDSERRYPATRISFAVVLAALTLLPWSTSLLIICLITVLALLFFKKPKNYFLRIKFTGNGQKDIRVHEQEVDDVKSFIREFIKFR